MIEFQISLDENNNITIGHNESLYGANYQFVYVEHPENKVCNCTLHIVLKIF